MRIGNAGTGINLFQHIGDFRLNKEVKLIYSQILRAIVAIHSLVMTQESKDNNLFIFFNFFNKTIIESLSSYLRDIKIDTEVHISDDDQELKFV